jgi:transcriptional regulator with XRE-family HTH domain
MPRNPPRPGPEQAKAQRQVLYAGLADGSLGLPEAVRRMRHLSGLTQADFARHRGISVQALRQLEAGTGNPTVATLDAIGAVFGLQAGFVPLQPDGAGAAPKRPRDRDAQAG